MNNFYKIIFRHQLLRTKTMIETYFEFLSWTPEILLKEKTQTNMISAAAKHIRNSCSPAALQLTLQGAPLRTPL